jgi:hypothetical protein
MAAGSVRLKGYRETMRALRKCEKGARDSWKDAFKEAAEPITRGSQAGIARYAGASTGTIGPRVVTSGVFVTQRKRKVTGRRGDFGALQMRIMLGVLADNEDEVEKKVEQAFDKLADSAGF